MASEGKGDDKVQPPEGCAPVFISSSDMEKLGYVIEKEYTALVVSSCRNQQPLALPKDFRRPGTDSTPFLVSCLLNQCTQPTA